jgi:hypothetical protein
MTSNAQTETTTASPMAIDVCRVPQPLEPPRGARSVIGGGASLSVANTQV